MVSSLNSTISIVINDTVPLRNVIEFINPFLQNISKMIFTVYISRIGFLFIQKWKILQYVLSRFFAITIKIGYKN